MLHPTMSQVLSGAPAEPSHSLSQEAMEGAFLSLAVEARALLGLVPSSYTPRGKVDGISTFDVDRRKVPSHGLEQAGQGELERDHPAHRFAVLGTGVRLYPPSALEFARVVAAHAPAVFAGVPEALFPRAWAKWNDTQYLRSRMGDRKAKVAFTPNGRADDLVTLPPGSEGQSTDGKVFALPYEAELTFDQLFDALHPPPGSDAPAAYLQSQNSNLCNPDRSEGDFSPLLEDLLATTVDPPAQPSTPTDTHAETGSTGSGTVRASSPPLNSSSASPPYAQQEQQPENEFVSAERRFHNDPSTLHTPSALTSTNGNPPHVLDIPFASAVFGVPPEAVNIWFGTATSSSSMHRDHYENLFVVLRGTKVFTLIPAFENVFIEDDKVYPVYRWERNGEQEGAPANASDLYLAQSQGSTPWLTVDPTLPPTSGRNRGCERYARAQRTHLIPPVRVVVRAGECLYLPAGWYHYVSQTEDTPADPKDATAIGLNFWYDTPLNDRWAWSNFATSLRQKVDGYVPPDDDA